MNEKIDRIKTWDDAREIFKRNGLVAAANTVSFDIATALLRLEDKIAHLERTVEEQRKYLMVDALHRVMGYMKENNIAELDEARIWIEISKIEDTMEVQND